MNLQEDPVNNKFTVNIVFDNYHANYGGNTIISAVNDFGKTLCDKNVINIFSKFSNHEEIIKRIKLLISQYININAEYDKILIEKGLKKMEKNSLLNIKKIDVYRSQKDINENIFGEYRKITDSMNIGRFKEFLYPMGLVTENGGHAIGTYFKKINDDKFNFYIINAGSGAGYQKIGDNGMYNQGIMCFQINNKKLNFIYTLLMAGDNFMTIDFFYNYLLRILFCDEEVIEDITIYSSKSLEESLFFVKSIETPLQEMGNCTSNALFYVIEILFKENNDAINTTLSRDYRDLYVKIKIYLIYNWFYYLKNLNDEQLNSIKNYDFYNKLNEIYNETNKKNKFPEYDDIIKVMIKEISSRYLTYIENYTKLKNVVVNEEVCKQIETIIKKDNDLSYLNNVMTFNKEKIKLFNNNFNEIFLKYKNNNFIINNIQEVNDFLIDLKKLILIIFSLVAYSEDMIISRFRQYQLIEIINNFTNQIIHLIEYEKIDKSFDMQEIIYNIRIITLLYGSINKNFFKKYEKHENNYNSAIIEELNRHDIIDYDKYFENFNRFEKIPEEHMPKNIKYKFTIYDTVLINFIIISGLLYDYTNTEKIIEHETKSIINLETFISNFIITCKEEIILLNNTNDNFTKYNKYFLKINNDLNIENPYGSVQSLDFPDFKLAGQKLEDVPNNLDIINSSTFSIQEFNVHYSASLEKIPTFFGNLDFNHFSNIFKEQIPKHYKTTIDFFSYLEKEITHSNNLNWLILNLNINLFNATIVANNFKKAEFIDNPVIIQNLVDFNILAYPQISSKKFKEHNDNELNKYIIDINNYFYLDSSNFFRRISAKMCKLSFGKSQNNHLLSSVSNFTLNKNISINQEILNIDYFIKILNDIAEMFRNGDIDKNIFASIFNIIISIIYIPIFFNRKFEKTTKLLESLKIIVNNVNPIIKLLLYFHDIDCEKDLNTTFNMYEVLEFMDRAIKFNKLIGAREFEKEFNNQFNLILNLVINLVLKEEKFKKFQEIILNFDSYDKMIINIKHKDSSNYFLDDNKVKNYYTRNNLYNNIGNFCYLKKVTIYKFIFNKTIYIFKYNKKIVSNIPKSIFDKAGIIFNKEKPQKYIIGMPGVSKLLSSKDKTIRIETDHMAFFYTYQDDISYSGYSLSKLYFNTDIFNDVNPIILPQKNIFKNEDNSLLQFYYSTDYSLINNLDFKLEDKTNLNLHISTFNNHLIKIDLSSDPVMITIDEHKILSIVEMIREPYLFSTYTKILNFINMNIVDRPYTTNMLIKTYLKNDEFNEIIPIVKNDVVQFKCFKLDIHFSYHMKSKKLFYMDEIEIITEKNYYYINKYIYNTNCLLAIDNNCNFLFMVMGAHDKNINFIKFNQNGIFSDISPEALIYYTRELINVGNNYEARNLLITINQNKKEIMQYVKKQKGDEQISLTISDNIKKNLIYSDYYLNILQKIMPSNIFVNDVLFKWSHIYKVSLKYFAKFHFNEIEEVLYNLTNSSFASNKEYIFKLNLLPGDKLQDEFKNFTLTKALLITNYLIRVNTKEILLSRDTDLYILKSFQSYQYFNHVISIRISKKINTLVHQNKKIILNSSKWINNDFKFFGIYTYKKPSTIPMNKEDIDINNFEKLTLPREYLCDTKDIINDYNDFFINKHKENKSYCDKDNLKKLKNIIRQIIFRLYKMLNNFSKRSNTKKYYGNPSLDFIYDDKINIKYFNLVMLAYKYINSYTMINTFLSIEQYEYKIDGLKNLLNTLPFYLNKEIDSSIICFEFLFGNHIRNKQYEFCEKLYNEITLRDLSGPNLHQLLMGEGKSSVIAPILTLNILNNYKESQDYSIIHVMPQSLILQSYTNFNKIFYYINRNLLNLISIEKELFNIHNFKIIIISDYLLKFMKVTDKDKRNFTMNKNFFIYDEVDEVSDPLKSQLNIIIEKPKKLKDFKLNFTFIHNFIFNLYFNQKYLSIRETLRDKYYFSLEPHLINQSSQITIEAIQIIYDLYLITIEETYESSYKIAFDKIIKNETLSESELKINYTNLDIIYKFYGLIPSILNLLHRRHFGIFYLETNKINILKKTKIYDEKEEKYINKFNKRFLFKQNKYFVAIPFISNEVPSIKSEFTNYLITTALTIISYYENSSRRIRNLDIQIYINYLKKIYIENNYKPDNNNIGYIKYLNLTSGMQALNIPKITNDILITSLQERDIEIIVKNFDVKFYLINILLPNVIKKLDEFDNISFTDIINSSFSKYRIGFTGTPFIHRPFENKPNFEIKKIVKQKNGDGAIVASIVGLTGKSLLIDNINNKNDVIITAILGNYHCIIDVGSYFINQKNINIANQIMTLIDKHGKHFDCVVFIDEKHNKLAVLKNGNVVAYESLNISLINRFYYFDQSHITGIDVKMYLLAKGLITLSSFNRYRDVAQGIFRMRNINNGQTVDFCFNNNFDANLQKFNNSLISLLIYNEFKYKISQASLFYKEEILTLYRVYFENNEMYNLPDISEKFYFLRKNIYRQITNTIEPKNIEDIKIDDITLFKEQTIEVLEFIKDTDLINMLKKSLDAFYKYSKISFSGNDISQAEIEKQDMDDEEEEEEEEEEQEQEEEEQQINQHLFSTSPSEHITIQICSNKLYSVNILFDFDKYKNEDIIKKDIENLSKYIDYPDVFLGSIPKTAHTDSDNQFCFSTEATPEFFDYYYTEKYKNYNKGVIESGEIYKILQSLNVDNISKIVDTYVTPRNTLPMPLPPRPAPFSPGLPSGVDDARRQQLETSLVKRDHKKFWLICKIIFKHIINNIYVPFNNIIKKPIFEIKYRDELINWKFSVDSWIDFFDDYKDSSTYLNYQYSLLIKHHQVMKIIEYSIKNNKLIKWNLISGECYYESNPELIKIYPSNYCENKFLILVLLESKKINTLQIYNNLDKIYEYPDDLTYFLSKAYNNKLSKFFGIFKKNDIDIMITYFKLIYDYTSLHSKDSTLFTLKNLELVIKKTYSNILTCKNKKIAKKYIKLLCNKKQLEYYIPKMKIFYLFYFNKNPNNILFVIKHNKKKLASLWNIVKYSNQENILYNNEFNKITCD